MKIFSILYLWRKFINMKTIRMGISLLLTLMTLSGFAQKLKWESGEDLAFLKGEKNVTVEYNFDNMIVGEKSETEFLEDKRKELNEDKAGSGDEFVTHWHEVKKTKYPKQFEENFNNALKKEELRISQSGESKYTVIVTTQNIKTGKGNAWRNKPAEIDFLLTIVETANKSNVVAKATLQDAKGLVEAPKGSGFIPGGAGRAIRTVAHFSNLEMTNRVAECYDMLADAFSKQVRKKL